MRQRIIARGWNEDIVKTLKGKKLVVKAYEHIANKGTLESFLDLKEQEHQDDVDQIDFGEGNNTGDFEPEDSPKVEDTVNEEVWQISASGNPPMLGHKSEYDTPSIGDPEWHDHVMSHFTEDELIDKNPNVDGLRRVAELLIGSIQHIITNVVQAPEPPERISTVTVQIVFENESSFMGAADTYYGNAEKPYRFHPTSMSETRAEGRALKRALRLRKIVAAEEIANVTDEERGSLELINSQQLQFLDMMCGPQRLNINVVEVMKQEGLNTNKINSITHDEAIKLNEKLNEYQNDKASIPEKILGYQGDWRK